MKSSLLKNPLKALPGKALPYKHYVHPTKRHQSLFPRGKACLKSLIVVLAASLTALLQRYGKSPYGLRIPGTLDTSDPTPAATVDVPNASSTVVFDESTLWSSGKTRRCKGLSPASSIRDTQCRGCAYSCQIHTGAVPRERCCRNDDHCR